MDKPTERELTKAAQSTFRCLKTLGLPETTKVAIVGGFSVGQYAVRKTDNIDIWLNVNMAFPLLQKLMSTEVFRSATKVLFLCFRVGSEKPIEVRFQ